MAKSNEGAEERLLRGTGAVICATPLKRLRTRLSPSFSIVRNSASKLGQKVFWFSCAMDTWVASEAVVPPGRLGERDGFGAPAKPPLPPVAPPSVIEALPEPLRVSCG